MNEPAEQKKSDNRAWLFGSALLISLASKFKVILPLASKLAVPMFSMLASIFAYAWMTRSWAIALGLVLMIFIHETGHVLAAKQKGLPVSLPIFLPFLGAFIAMKRNPRDAVTEAYIAIGGPVVGSAGALVVYLLGVGTGNKELIIVAYFGFFINLLNLLPIHPLDGGRIASAVSRVLWVFGLIGGLVVILYLRSLLFFFIWAMFAWELYGKYVRKRKKGAFVLPFQIQIPIEYLRFQGAFIPGEQHQRELSFVTWSETGGDQIVAIEWDSLGFKEQVTLKQQYLIKNVKVVGTKHVHDDSGQLKQIVAHCEISGYPHENDRYYDVPASTRWTYGTVYIGLAIFLIMMTMIIQHSALPGVMS